MRVWQCDEAVLIHVRLSPYSLGCADELSTDIQSAAEAFLKVALGGGPQVISFPAIAAILLFLYVLNSIKILKEYERGVIFRLGRLLERAKGPGIILVFAPVDRMVRISLRQEALEVPAQDIITRDNVTLKYFENLPVTTKVYELSAEERICPGCGVERQEMGADESWQIEHIPGRFERIQHVRKKYACPGCEKAGENPQMEVTAKPEATIDKGMAGPGLLAYIVTSKFADYLPLSPAGRHFRTPGV